MHFLNEVRILRDEGKLHARLITRTRILLGISLVLGGITIFNIIYRGADWMFAGGLVLAGLILGLFVFSRMNPVQWNEEQAIIETGRMDTVGYIILVLYIALEIGLRTFLKDFYPLSATTLILAGVFGVLFGRAIGTLIEVHRAYKAAHS